MNTPSAPREFLPLTILQTAILREYVREQGYGEGTKRTYERLKRDLGQDTVHPAVDDTVKSNVHKGRGVPEHGVHARDAVNHPIADVLVEGRGAVEHPFHARDAGGVPRADVVVEGRRR